MLLLAAVAGLVSLPLRWLCTSDVPMSWDGVQYILAVEEFDVARHQPHPPGYYLFVWSARVVHAMHLSPLTSLLLVSALAIAGLTSLVVFWAGRLGGLHGAVAAAALCLSSPLTFALAADERSYAVGALGSGVVGVLCWRLWRGRARGGPADGLLSGVALGLLAGLRQTDALLLVPLWTMSLLRRDRRAVLLGLIGVTLAIAAWAVPFLRGVGGLGEYLVVSNRLASVFVQADQLPDQLSGAPHRATIIAVGVLGTLGIGWVFVPWIVGTPLGRSTGFAALWLVPSLLMFLLGHAANVFYVGVFAPLLLVAGAAAMGRFLRAVRPPWVGWAVVALVVVGNVPLIISGVFVPRRDGAALVRAMGQACAPWNRRDTLALTSHHADGRPRLPGAIVPFRHAMYFMPEARVFIFPLERSGPPGTMPNGGFRMHTLLQAPPKRIEGVRSLLLLGRAMTRYLPRGQAAQVIRVSDELELVHVALSEGSVVVLGADGALTIDSTGLNQGTEAPTSAAAVAPAGNSPPSW